MRSHPEIFAIAMGLSLALASCGPDREKPAPGQEEREQEDAGVREGEQGEREAGDGIERFGSTAIVPVRVEGIEALTAERLKALRASWNQAIEADREAYAEGGPQHLRIRELLAGILSNSAGIPSSITRKLEPYAALYAVNHGPVIRETGERVKPRFIPGQLAAAAQIALANGAAMDLPEARGEGLAATRVEELEALLELVRPWIFGDGPAAAPDAGVPEGEAADPAELTKGALVAVPAPGLEKRLAEIYAAAPALQRAVRKVGGNKSAIPSPAPTRVRPVIALAATGRYGPLLPSDTDLYWSGPTVAGEEGDVLYLANVDDAFEAAVGSKLIRAFARDEEEAKRRTECRPMVRPVFMALREIGGRGADGTEKKPDGWLADRLGEEYLAMEELRADLGALYLASDGKGGGLEEGCEEAILEEYLAGALESAGSGDLAGDPRWRARQAVAAMLLKGGGVAFAEPGEDKVALLEVKDRAAAARSIKTALAEARRIRFAGDRRGAEAMLGGANGWLSPERRRAIAARLEGLGLPKLVAFGYPILVFPKGEKGSGIPRLEVPGTFLEGQLRLERLSRPGP